MQNNNRFFRKQKNLTQTDLALLSGCSKNTISSLERKEFQPTLKLAFILSRVLDVSIYDLFPTDYYGSPCKVTKFIKHS